MMARRAAPWVLVLGLSACIDFDALRAQCELPGGRCAPPTIESGMDGGTEPGPDAGPLGESVTDGGTDAGTEPVRDAGPLSGVDAGADGGPGSDVDAGSGSSCAGCFSDGQCLSREASDVDDACGSGGVACQRCSESGQTCRAQRCVPAQAWFKKYTLNSRQPLTALSMSEDGGVWAGGPNVLVRGRGGIYEEIADKNLSPAALVSLSIQGRPMLVVAGANGTAALVQLLPVPWFGDYSDLGFSQATFWDVTNFSTAFVAGGRLHVAGGLDDPSTASVRRFHNGAWLDVTPTASLGRVVSGWGTPSGDYYLLTEDPAFARVSGGRVDIWPLRSRPRQLWGGTGASIWLVGSSMLGRFQDGNFAQFPIAEARGLVWYSVWAASDERVFVVGRTLSEAVGYIGEWDGILWRIVSPKEATAPFNAVSGSGDDVWAVDNAGSIWHLE